MASDGKGGGQFLGPLSSSTIFQRRQKSREEVHHSQDHLSFGTILTRNDRTSSNSSSSSNNGGVHHSEHPLSFGTILSRDEGGNKPDPDSNSEDIAVSSTSASTVRLAPINTCEETEVVSSISPVVAVVPADAQPTEQFVSFIDNNFSTPPFLIEANAYSNYLATIPPPSELEDSSRQHQQPQLPSQQQHSPLDLPPLNPDAVEYIILETLRSLSSGGDRASEESHSPPAQAQAVNPAQAADDFEMLPAQSSRNTADDDISAEQQHQGTKQDDTNNTKKKSKKVMKTLMQRLTLRPSRFLAAGRAHGSKN